MVSSRDKYKHWHSAAGPLFALGVAMTLGGCLSGGDETRAGQTQVASAIMAPTNIGLDKLIGSWGIASFHTEKDRKRTEAQAKAGCNQPYVIKKGPDDGVMMHVADDAKIYELRLKAGPGGRTFLGFEAPAGDPQDREILSATDSMLVMRFVDPDANRRYGTFIYARCR
ncbi:MAG TPA: hypothetical protein VGN82_25555 [Bosea sp. (in: a-proteobacteria)]|jgi:hypothetical protein|nr:hypothetical protein [Bosea sp. (in: a-proteobacteria)]